MNKDEKNLAKSGPMGGIFALSHLDNIFKDAFNRFDAIWKEWNLDMAAFDKLQPRSSFPKVNVIEREDSYEVQIAVAGFGKDDVSIEFKDNAMCIKADKNEVTSDDCCGDGESCCKKYLVREIASRSFRRVVVFPGEIDAQKISAKYEDGIIKCVVGKVIEETPTTIKIDIE